MESLRRQLRDFPVDQTRAALDSVRVQSGHLPRAQSIIARAQLTFIRRCLCHLRVEAYAVLAVMLRVEETVGFSPEDRACHGELDRRLTAFCEEVTWCVIAFGHCHPDSFDALYRTHLDRVLSLSGTCDSFRQLVNPLKERYCQGEHSELFNR